MIRFSFSNRHYELNDKTIEAICLFGSWARGDQDIDSDVDLFFLIDDCDDEMFLSKKQQLVEQLGMPASWLSMYRKSTILRMQKHGSYFLWHLKLEGIIKFSKTGMLEDVLNTLPAYNKAKDDLLEYLQICGDIKTSILGDPSTSKYEFNLLASLARNTCISLAHICGLNAFGRTQPIRACSEILGEQMAFSLEEYLDLYRYRIDYIRQSNLDLPYPTESAVLDWVGKIERLIQLALHKLNEGGEHNGTANQPGVSG